MSPEARRTVILAATLAVAGRKGLGATTVRDVAAEMGTSSGLIHHYFPTMDHVLASAFEHAAGQDLWDARGAVDQSPDSIGRIAAFVASYSTGDDSTMQLWLDAWSEAARRPELQAVSKRLNFEWHSMLVEIIREGVSAEVFNCPDPIASAWRILSVLDGIALQRVAHGEVVDHADAGVWMATAATLELDISADRLVDAISARAGA